MLPRPMAQRTADLGRCAAGQLAKLLPRELSADLKVQAEAQFDFSGMSDDELERYIAATAYDPAVTSP
jgi:hypothetical protein